MAKFESFLAGIEPARREAVAEGKQIEHVRPNDPPDIRAKQLRGLIASVRNRYHDQTFFTSCENTGLFRCGIAARARMRLFRRIARGGQIPTWTLVRDEVHHALGRAFDQAHTSARKLKRELIVKATKGRLDPGNVAPHMEELRRLEKAMKRGQGKAQISAIKEVVVRANLTVVNGVKLTLKVAGNLLRDPEPMHNSMADYGKRQNSASKAIQNAFTTMLQTCIPQGDKLRMPDGTDWTIRKAITFPVFARELGKATTGKAGGLHPFLIDHLRALTKSSQALKTYYHLIIHCMETGDYPSYYGDMVACLIPKTYGDSYLISALRDIWLGQHGAKLVQRLILKTALAPLADRLRPEAAGFCKARTTSEQAFALHCAIRFAHHTRTPIFVMYIDLSKCFMSFNRSHGMIAADWYGLPTEARKALTELERTISGRYESVYGTTQEFEVIRGFIQGSLHAPELCKQMMNTVLELVNLKCAGVPLFSVDDNGDELLQLVFADDAVNSASSVSMTQRIADFWSLWCAVVGMEMNIAGIKKTAWSGLVWVVKNGTLTATNATGNVTIQTREGVKRRVPPISIHLCYKYLGYLTRLDGLHGPDILKKMVGKIDDWHTKVRTIAHSRKHSVELANEHK